ncbi:MAG TPA: hypothetical protein DCM68_01595, partial [Verrucomicrobia bacterium]|nr:hypothetical protein [Verrucomicrobiota bacterium]
PPPSNSHPAASPALEIAARDPSAKDPLDMVSLDERQIAAYAEHLKTSGTAKAFDFCAPSEGFLYPERHQPGVLETFFFSCSHQFGFWTLNSARWNKPMIARLDGRDLKGSDFMFRACTRAWQRNPRVFFPDTLATMGNAQLSDVFRDDDGANPLPMWAEHLALIHGYAQWFVSRNLEPADVLRRAAADSKPLYALLTVLAEVPGYAEDPLQKKAMLLAIVLENRPEHFLKVTDPESAVPIIDYHLQRSALRAGLVRVVDPTLRAKLEARQLLSAGEEFAIRSATYEAIAAIMAQAELSAAAVDWFFFQNRTRCPETSDPKCPECPVQAICAKETRLFQPVFRTTAY